MKNRTIQVSLADIQRAQNELRKYLEPSPLLRNAWLSENLGCEVFLKLENMQPVGSFKIRGATYKISKLTAPQRKRGVIAASAGNHAQGVAWGSKRLGVSSLIVMPKQAAIVKVQNTRAMGAEVVLAGDNYDEAYIEAQKIARKSGRVFVHAYEDADVIAGQGTLALEVMEQLPDLDMIIGSIGGGGMMSGIGTVIRELRPEATIVGCQAKGANSMLQSIKKGRAVARDRVETFADGIAVARASEVMRKILARTVDEFIEADDESIAASVLTLLEKAKVTAEGSAAISLTALEKIGKRARGKKVVLVICGGNIDVNVLSRIIDRGLIRAGRRVRVNVILSDRPGSLARLTGLIADQGANVLQAIHDRSEPSTTIDQTDVALTLETRGPEHSRALIKALREHVIRLDLTH
jgi:threonine dehydratase